MHASTDNILAPDKWQFDSDVTAAFDNMLARSIPQYAVMRQACYDLASDYVQLDTDIVDIGCSRGEAIAALLERHGATNRFVGLEISEPMLEAARERFQERVDIRPYDLRKGYPSDLKASVTLSILTLQFTPLEYRLRIVHDIFKSTLPNGVFILVEKVLGASAELDSEMVKRYYALKSDNGYTTEQIERKRLSLEGVLVPVTAKWNEEILRGAGFSQVDCFWRWMNFSGWIAIK